VTALAATIRAIAIAAGDMGSNNTAVILTVSPVPGNSRGGKR